MPVISIGMSVKNSAGTVASAVASVLSQDFADWELIVIDDGSTDDTAAIVRGFSDRRIRLVVHAENRGLAARLNEAVHLSGSEYFARMDGDDIMYPERLRLQYEFLQKHPDVDLVGGGAMVFRGGGIPLGIRGATRTHDQICAHPWRGFPVAHPTWLGRIAWFRENSYPEEMLRAEDQALLLRSYGHSRFATLGRIILGYREERFTLRKVLRGRFYSSCASLRYGKGVTLRTLAVAKQTVACIADVVASTTGLEYRILRHRARPARPYEIDRWRKVWSETQRNAALFTGLEPSYSEQ